jgi:hypothetical protein
MHVHSYSKIEQSVILPQDDVAWGRISHDGIVLVTKDMLNKEYNPVVCSESDMQLRIPA